LARLTRRLSAQNLFSKVTNTSKVTPIAIKLKNWTADKLSTLKASWNEHELSSSVKAAQAKAAPIGDMLKDKLGLDPSVNSNALALSIPTPLPHW